MKATPFNQKTIDEFHAKKGRGVGLWGDHVALLTAKGAKSREAITTPLVCGRDGDNYVIVASKGGAPTNPAWFGNLKANPEVEVEVASDEGTEKFTARAPAGEERAEPHPPFKKMCKLWPPEADHRKGTGRLRPTGVLQPQPMPQGRTP